MMFLLKCFSLLCCLGYLVSSSLDLPLTMDFLNLEILNEKRDQPHQNWQEVMKEAEINHAAQQTRRATAKSEATSYYEKIDPMTNKFHKGTPESRATDNEQAKYEEMARIFKIRNFNEQQMNEAAKEAMKCPEKDANCDPLCPYRLYNGTCNNLKYPNWGSDNICFLRLMPASYDDGISKIRKAKSGKDLPTPRNVSLTMHGYYNQPDQQFSHMMMQFGQFLTHDTTRVPKTTKSDGSSLKCCSKTEDRQCADIKIEKDDPFFSQYNVSCLPTSRSERCKKCSFGEREQIHLLTSFVDASNVYEVSHEANKNLRTFKKGQLKAYYSKKCGELLPRQPKSNNCNNKQNEHERCFFCGDARCTQHPALAVLQLIFQRLHNLIAKELSHINEDIKEWDDETIFQETRRIVGAIVQCITYKEFLPLLVGVETMIEWDLLVGTDTEYNPHVNPTIYNEFEAVAFRYGHVTIASSFAEVHENGGIDSFELRDKFFNIFGFYQCEMPRIAKGLLISPSLKFGRHAAKDVTNHVYQASGECFGSDLMALDILRGRDHGMQPFTAAIKHFNGPNIKTFQDLETYGIVTKGSAKLLADQYESVHDIDLFTGATCEPPVPGGLVGRTLVNIIAPQFHNLKFGDRWYFENKNLVPSFTPAQRDEIRKVSLGKVLCSTDLGMESTQKNAFLLPSEKNSMIPCPKGPPIDLRHWYNQISGSKSGKTSRGIV